MQCCWDSKRQFLRQTQVVQQRGDTPLIVRASFLFFFTFLYLLTYLLYPDHIAPALTVRRSSKRSSYTDVTYMQRAQASLMQVSWLLVWVSSWTSHGLRIPQFLATYTPAHLVVVDRTNYEFQAVWLGWCPKPSTGSCAQLQEMAGSDSFVEVSLNLKSQDLLGLIPSSWFCTDLLLHKCISHPD